MAKIGPYPRARRASRLWYNTVIFAFCSGRKGKEPLGESKAGDSKAGVPVRAPWVRIPPLRKLDSWQHF